MKTITIRVTKADIKKATDKTIKNFADASQHCVVATAMRRHGLRPIMVGFHYAEFSKNRKHYEATLDDYDSNYILRFMNHKTVRPRNITLYVKEGR